MIKAIFIDIDGTLLDFEACVEESMRLGLIERGVDYKAEMLETFHRINNGLWRDLEQGKLTFEKLLEIRWATVFAELGINLDGLEFEKYFRARLHKSAIPMDGSYEMLGYLSEKYRLFAASNGPDEQQKKRLEKADMLRGQDRPHQDDAGDLRLLHHTEIFDLALFIVFGVAEDRHIARLVQNRRYSLDQVADRVGVDLGHDDADAVGTLLTQ